MAYTAVKGGAEAVAAAEELVRRPPVEADEGLLELRQIRHQLGAAVDKVMGEGGLYAPDLAALAIQQAEGDLFEASFMLRAYRSTLPRFGSALPVGGEEMTVVRRISSSFKDVPGGQLLGRTRDYTQRLLDFGRLAQNGPGPDGAALPGANGHAPAPAADEGPAPAPLPADGSLPKVSRAMRAMGVMAEPAAPAEAPEPDDITRDAPRFPVSRPAWLQALARGESGALVCLAYSSLRGYGGRADHATIAELRVGDLPLRVTHPLTGEPVTIGAYRATEVEMTGPGRAAAPAVAQPPRYDLSYGLVFGQHERKAIAMALLDSTLGAKTAAAGSAAPANDQEMVLYHVDGIESFGFVEHLKLPHFVTFGSGLQLVLEERAAGAAAAAARAGSDRGEAHDHDVD